MKEFMLEYVMKYFNRLFTSHVLFTKDAIYFSRNFNPFDSLAQTR